MKTKLAVFDIDGTIFRWTFIVELLQALTTKGIFPKKIIKKTEKVYFDWVDRKGSWDSYINTVVGITNSALAGCSEEEIDKVIKEVIFYKKNKLYVFTRDLIKELKKKNYFLLAISASPEKMVSEFTKELGFDKYYGTVYEVKKGKYTGKQLRQTFSVKHEVLKNFLKENPKIKLKNSIGVGDSESDISFLEMVENPIAFNPNDKLIKYAKKKKWRIVVERKNVIYDLKNFTFKSTS